MQGKEPGRMTAIATVVTCFMRLAASLALVAVAMLAMSARQTVLDIGKSAVRMADSEERIEKAITPLPAALEADVKGLSQDILHVANTQATGLRADARGAIGDSLNVAQQSLDDTLKRADAALSEIDGMRAQFQPVLAGAEKIETDADKTVNDLHPQLLGLVAASKVTAGEAGTTMRTIRDATPAIVAQVKDIGQHIDATATASQKASEQTALTMEHLAETTKTLPSWLRTALQVGGPAAMILYYLVLTGVGLKI